MILGAVGTGKTSACMYPYVDQLLRWQGGRSGAQARWPGPGSEGRLLPARSDRCSHRTGRDADYVEVGLDTGVCYNPLHNDLDPYAVAYAIATLLNNLFGRSKEPFWQQAYTDLLKFVILLRRISDGYTTFSEVYRYILDDQQIDRDIRRLKADLAEPPDVLVIRHGDFREHCIQKPWAHWFAEDAGPHGAPVRSRAWRRSSTRAKCVVRSPRSRRAPGGRHGSTSSRPSSAGICTAGVGSTDGSARPSSKASSCSCRCSTTTRRCIARSVRREVPTSETRQPGEPQPLAPIDALLESGKVLALNFPVAMNPGLARILGVMLKLDFQRAVLQRIPQITAQPERIWRDLLFVCDEYHAFATVGEDGSDRRRAHVRAVPAGAADSDRRHAEHQLAAVGAAGR